VNHATGLAGMPRRIYDATYAGHPAAQSWQAWTGISAMGGVVLFVSAMFFVSVMLGTMTARKLDVVPGIEYAETARPLTGQRVVWDRIGLWVVLAVVMIVIAYAYPITRLVQLERFGSPPLRVF
jgi:cytochrome c oxidase subunit I